MRQIIVGNWKMNGTARLAAGQAEILREAAPGLACDLVLCPPATLIAALVARLAGRAIGVGGQDCHSAASGAHTGDIAAGMLAEAGARYVILGHSERRADHGETDAMVRAKAAAARAAGLTPIVCVGEDQAERLAGRAEAVVVGQLAASLPEDFSGTIAYEPIWAIGAGRTPTLEDVTAMHRAIRACLAERFGLAGRAFPVLYGGSVKAANAREILALPEVGGALVGGASLDPAEFLAIARAARPPDR